MSNLALITKAANAFDKVRQRFFDTDAELLLLRPSDTENEYHTVLAVYESWWFDSAKNILYVAKDSWDFQEAMQEATHAQPGPDIYRMVPDDITAPDTKSGGRVYWTIQLEKFERSGQFSPIY